VPPKNPNPNDDHANNNVNMGYGQPLMLSTPVILGQAFGNTALVHAQQADTTEESVVDLS
jgi:hypothetical protein